MVTQRTNKKTKTGSKTKSSGWTLDTQKFQPLSEDRLKELAQLETIHGVSLKNIESFAPSNPPDGSIILPLAVVLAGISIPLPGEVC